jgi:hypothetical protein
MYNKNAERLHNLRKKFDGVAIKTKLSRGGESLSKLIDFPPLYVDVLPVARNLISKGITKFCKVACDLDILMLM